MVPGPTTGPEIVPEIRLSGYTAETGSREAAGVKTGEVGGTSAGGGEFDERSH